MRSSQVEYESTLRLLEEHTINAASVQHRLLCDILAHNSHTEYLCKLFPTSCSLPLALADAPAAIDPHSFKLFAPLSSYEDLLPFIDRIASGDKSPILTACPVTEFFQSSGTSSGERKIFPAIENDTERGKLFTTYASLVESEIKSHLQGLDGGKQMNFLFMRPDEWTASGMLMRPRSARFYKNPHVRQHLEEVHVSPMEVVLECEDASQSAYTQLLCGLIRRKEVVCVGATFASSLLHVLHIFQQRWYELVEDIRSGCLSKTAVIGLSVRKAVEALIHGPDPTLAIQVEAECSREPLWKGIVPRLWPQAKYISCATSGSMEQYISKLEFFTGDLPLVSTVYGGSEAGGYGINMSPLCSPYEVSYTILPDMAYFEFLPLDATDNALNDHSCLVDLVNVELGKEYEMVLTTFAGLYRFRVGDVVRVTGFYNKTPQLRLVGRKNVVLSVDVDKTDEVTLERAVQAARVGHLEVTGGLLVDYTSYTDASTFPGHYVLFWEVTICNSSGVDEGRSLHEQIPSAHVLEECCLAMERCFDNVYKYLRQQNKIGPLEIRVVKEGTFHDLMNYSVARGASISQYKTPRVIKLAPMVEFFNSKVSYTHKTLQLC